MILTRTHEKLKSGAWVVEDILSMFERKLQVELGTGKAKFTVSELCLSYYAKLGLNNISLRSDSFGLSDLSLDERSREYIVDLLKTDHLKAEVGVFTENEKVKINEAFSIVKDACVYGIPNVSKVFQTFLKVENVIFRSASHPHVFGVMFIGEPIKNFTAEQVAVSIVHEMAHQELFLITLLDRLINQAYDYHEIHAPFQGRKRPPIGRIHSLWALYRMVQFQNRIGKANLKHQALMKENIKAFESGELTKFGEDLVKIVENEAT